MSDQSDFTIQAEAAVKRVQQGIGSFAADMRAQGIHVGMGSNPRCVNCGEAWPCSSERPAGWIVE